MRKIQLKKCLSLLLAAAVLMSALVMGVSAADTTSDRVVGYDKGAATDPPNGVASIPEDVENSVPIRVMCIETSHRYAVDLEYAAADLMVSVSGGYVWNVDDLKYEVNSVDKTSVTQTITMTLYNHSDRPIQAWGTANATAIGAGSAFSLTATNSEAAKVVINQVNTEAETVTATVGAVNFHLSIPDVALLLGEINANKNNLGDGVYSEEGDVGTVILGTLTVTVAQIAS